MNKILLIVCAALAMAHICARAQEGSGAMKEIPRPPYIAEAPAYATWVIQFSAAKQPKAKPAPGDAGSAKHIRQVEITKTDKTRRTVVTYSDGTKQESWYFDGFDLFQVESGKIVILDPASNDLAPSYGGFKDFDGLQWLDARFFEGRVGVGERVCNHFKRTADSGAELEAWIDADSKLPVGAVEGDTRRIYTFGAPPTAPLQLPPAFKAVYDFAMKPARDAVRLKMIP